jgi:hypothetical protein
MYKDIYPASSGITLIPNEVLPQQGRKVKSHFLDTLTYATDAGKKHITLYDKRSSYNFEVNRVLDIDTNASRLQSHSVFFEELVRIFRVNTHEEGFLQNSAETSAYLIVRKNYSQEILTRLFIRFVRS